METMYSVKRLQLSSPESKFFYSTKSRKNEKIIDFFTKTSYNIKYEQREKKYRTKFGVATKQEKYNTK